MATPPSVLIIGAGPTGTTLALELAHQHIPLRIIDQASSRSPYSRALVLQPRTLELLSRHSGVSAALTAAGTTGTGARVFVNKRAVADVDLRDLGGGDETAFPLPLWISQVETERCLDGALEGLGVRAERGIRAVEVVQDGDGVVVLLKKGVDGGDGVEEGEEEEQVRVKYVVGCDGAHSVVRHAAGMTFHGSAYPQEFLLADVHLDWSAQEDGDTRMSLFFGQGMMVGFPLKDGLFRLVVGTMAGNTTAEKDGEPTLEDFQRVWEAMAPGEATLRDPVWLSRFRLHHRGVDSYRKGRLFVAGDAAHIHSPAGGQGMNTGIQDAINLGWKLAAVLHGKADEKLLDSYDSERRRVGEHLLQGTDRAFQFGASGNPFFIFFRNLLVPWVLPWAMGDRTRRARMFRFISQLGIRYRHSRIVGTASTYTGPLRGGDRAPDGLLKGLDHSSSMHKLCVEPIHHLVLFSGTGSAAADNMALQKVADTFSKERGDLADISKVFTQAIPESSAYFDENGQVHTRYGFTEPGYVLVRPDGYLAHIGNLNAFDEFMVWFKGYMTVST